jgi:hypothetical protein
VVTSKKIVTARKCQRTFMTPPPHGEFQPADNNSIAQAPQAALQ